MNEDKYEAINLDNDIEVIRDEVIRYLYSRNVKFEVISEIVDRDISYIQEVCDKL